MMLYDLWREIALRCDNFIFAADEPTSRKYPVQEWPKDVHRDFFEPREDETEQ